MRKRNFFAGPSVLPVEVLEQIRDNIVDYEGQGLSMIEASHRGGMFEEMYDQCLDLFRKLLGIPEDYDVYFLGGGATLQFTMIPMNFLLEGRCADYVMRVLVEQGHQGRPEAWQGQRGVGWQGVELFDASRPGVDPSLCGQLVPVPVCERDDRWNRVEELPRHG